jgi:ketosteroid isomerase-like protein
VLVRCAKGSCRTRAYNRELRLGLFSVILAPMADVVRTQVGPNARLPTRRTLDERVFARWPGVFAAVRRGFSLLPPPSRLRRALVRRSALSAWGAYARRDIDLLLMGFAPDLHYEPPREWLSAGIRSVYRGHAGYREWVDDMREAFEEADLMPREIFDAGEMLVVHLDLHVRAGGSGVELDYRYAVVVWLERGLVVRERDFLDWDEALRAAGFSAEAADSSGRPAVTTTQ